MSGMDARDLLTVVLTQARRNGVTISEREFRGPVLADDIRSARETIRALDGALARCEDMARAGGSA